VFLHPVEFAGHVVYSIAPGPRNVNTLFFVLGWDRYGFNKKCNGTCHAEHVSLHSMGYVVHVEHSVGSGARNRRTIFHARLGPVRFP
jgi:hypothetical protein